MVWNFDKRLVFFCPSSIVPSGGVKQIYRNVKILKDIGLNVILVLDNSGDYNRTWLNNDYNISPYYNPNLFLTLYKNRLSNKDYYKNIKHRFKSLIRYSFIDSRKIWKVNKEDILVIPEIWTKDFQWFYVNNSKIIFNQNCFYTINNFAYLKNLKGVITVSNYSYNFLQLIYKDKVKRISLGIDTDTFSFEKKKRKLISYMSRKRPDDIEQILFLTKLCDEFNEWEFLNISNSSELEVARALKQSFIFLSTSEFEGFGLPPAEAMACGCIVIGYDGGGGEEYLNNGFSFNIQSGDILEFFNCLKKIVVEINFNINCFDELRKSASDFIKMNYSLENEKISVQETWVKLISNI